MVHLLFFLYFFQFSPFFFMHLKTFASFSFMFKVLSPFFVMLVFSFQAFVPPLTFSVLFHFFLPWMVFMPIRNRRRSSIHVFRILRLHFK